MQKIESKYGVVVLMDALGARDFSEEKIHHFLSAREELNRQLNADIQELLEISKEYPINITTYTFGDTLIIVSELAADTVKAAFQFHSIAMVLQNYMYYSMHHEILFRGAISIGTYIDDEKSNTVMGEAVSDAASWYEKSEWFGISATPKAGNIIDLMVKRTNFLSDPLFLLEYPVPMKDGREIRMHCISWPGRFHQEQDNDPEIEYLELISKQKIPPGTETKYINSKKYFDHVSKLIKGQKKEKHP